jgi:UPF0288 family protein (methanogenesis marker protein 3)
MWRYVGDIAIVDEARFREIERGKEKGPLSLWWIRRNLNLRTSHVKVLVCDPAKMSFQSMVLDENESKNC